MNTQFTELSESTIFVAGLAGRYKVDRMKRLVSTLKEILSHEICFNATSTGLSIKQLNLAKTILVDVEIAVDFFYQYDINEPSGLFAVDAQRMEELVQQANSRLVFSLRKDNSEHELLCEWRDGSATLPVFDAADETSSPNLTPAIKASVIAKNLKASLGMIDADYFRLQTSTPFSELLIIQDSESTTKEKRIRQGSGLLSIDCLRNESRDSGDDTSSEALDETTVSAVYSTKAVQNMLKVWANESRVTLEFDTNRPLALKFRFGKLILAPRALRE